MVEAGVSGLVANAAGSDPTAPGQARYREVRNTKVGDLTLVFRVTEATGESGNLIDGIGRPILWVEGLVFKGRRQEIAISQDDLDRAHVAVEPQFRDFWKETTDTPARASSPISLEERPANPVKLAQIEPIVYGRDTERPEAATVREIEFHHIADCEFDIDCFFITIDFLAVIIGKKFSILHLYNLRSCEWSRPISLLNSSGFGSAAFQPHTQQIAITNNDYNNGGEIWLWDFKKQENIRRTKKFEEPFSAICFHPNGRILACGSETGRIGLWDWSDDGKGWFSSERQHAKTINSIAISPDGSLLASGGDDREVLLWNLTSAGSLGVPSVLAEHSKPVKSIAFSPNGEYVVSASEDRTIKFWRISERTTCRTSKFHRKSVNSLAFSPDSRTLASGSSDGTVGLRDLHRDSPDQPFRILEAKGGEVISVEFSHEGLFLAVATMRKINVWLCG
jgi:WD40 repeat protein